jgi:hypothetical protein
MAEQDTAISSIASVAQKQASGLSAITRAATEQASASEEIARASAEMRVQAKEVASAVAQTVKNMIAVATEVGGIAAQVGRIREANVQHADAVASITGALIESRGQQLRVEKA